MTLRIGRLRPDTYELNLHNGPNGDIVGTMSRDDRFALDNAPAIRNPGGTKEWVIGRVNMTGNRVWVVLDRLIVEEFADRPAPSPIILPPDPDPVPTPPPRPKPQPKLVRPSVWDVFCVLFFAVLVLIALWLVGSWATRTAWPYLFTPAAAEELTKAEDLPVHGTCWACMHGCTRKQNIENCGRDPGPTTQDQADCWLFETQYQKPCYSYEKPKPNFECWDQRDPMQRVCIPARPK